MSGVELTTTLGTTDVQNVVLRLPLHGNWDATMDIAATDRPADGSAATLRIARSDGTIDTFVGSVRRAQVTPGTQNLSVTIVGGGGRLIDEIPARHHTAGAATVPAGLVLRGIADAAGYVLAAGVEAAIDVYPLQRYTRVRQAADFALNCLAATISTAAAPIEWRVLADGALWMGVDTWPPVDASAFYWRGDPRDGAVWYVPDGAPYRPGTTIASRPDTTGARVAECCYAIEPGRPSMEARSPVRGDPVYPAQLQAYARSYVCTVVSQNADDTLNLRSGDPTLGDDLRNVPFKLGIPGTRVTVPAGSIVRVAFEGGLPTGIYAGDIDMNAAADKAFALKDDTVRCGTLTGVANLMTGAITFTWTPASGDPPVIGASAVITGFIFGPCHAYAKGKPSS